MLEQEDLTNFTFNEIGGGHGKIWNQRGVWKKIAASFESGDEFARSSAAEKSKYRALSTPLKSVLKQKIMVKNFRGSAGNQSKHLRWQER